MPQGPVTTELDPLPFDRIGDDDKGLGGFP